MIFILCLLSILILISPIIIKQVHNLISILPTYVTKIQIFINNGDMAAAMLRIVEVIGQDELKDIDEILNVMDFNHSGDININEFFEAFRLVSLHHGDDLTVTERT